MIIQEPTRLFVPNTITWQVSRADGTVEPAIYVTNARTDAGANAIAQLCGLAGALPFAFVGLSADLTAVVKTDTALTGELTLNASRVKPSRMAGSLAQLSSTELRRSRKLRHGRQRQMRSRSTRSQRSPQSRQALWVS